MFLKNNIVHYLKKIASCVVPTTMHEFSNCLLLLIFYKAITHNRSDLFNNEPPLALFINNDESFANITNHADFSVEFLGVILDKIQREYGLDLLNKMPDIEIGKIKQVMGFIDEMTADIVKFSEYQEFLQETYEILLFRYGDRGATNAEFHTPYQVSELIARILKQRRRAFVIYDFACGSGSLLIGAHKHKPHARVIGKDLNANVLNISRMNLALSRATAVEIEQADALLASHEPIADWVVANPPFSVDAKKYPAFENSPLVADWLFVMQGLKALKSGGVMAIILPTGALFRNVERAIRKTLIEKGQVAGVVVLPRKIFENTPVQTCVLILDKNGNNDHTTMVDVGDDDFVDKKHLSGYVMRVDAIDLVERAFLNEIQSKETIYAKHVGVADIANENFSLLPQYYLDPPKLKHKPFAETFDACSKLDGKISLLGDDYKNKILEVKK